MIKFVFVLFFPLLGMSCASQSKPKDIVIGKQNMQVDVSFYSASEKGTVSKLSILILPPTGGTNFIDRSYAKALQKAGFDVYILSRWTGDQEAFIDLDIHQTLYSRAQAAISEVIQQIQTPYIGMLGTSVGTLHASVAASTQERLNAVFIITGGTSISEVIVTSDQKAMLEAKAKRYEKYGFKNDADYLAALQQRFQLDPTKLGDQFKSKTLGMVIATNDSTVPTPTQFKLQNLWNPSRSIEVKSNHFWAIVKTWIFETDFILDFFNKDSMQYLNQKK